MIQQICAAHFNPISILHRFNKESLILDAFPLLKIEISKNSLPCKKCPKLPVFQILTTLPQQIMKFELVEKLCVVIIYRFHSTNFGGCKTSTDLSLIL
jgi:hypothetical protein